MYTVSSSEKLRKSGADTETKALLYLMNFHEEKEEINYFIIDFFNDLTGMDNMSEKLWDVQSKGASKTSPKATGKELVTLYKNFVSEFEFNRFILFMGGISNTVRKDSSKNIFGINNITETSLEKLKEGLIEECRSKTYIDNSDIDLDRINEFLEKVTFVIDDKDASEYVRAIIDSDITMVPTDEVLIAIFNEVRDIQSGKKNGKNVEGISITSVDESLNYLRHLTSAEIKMLVLGRIINRNPFDKGCPTPFVDIYSSFPEEKREEQLENCKLSLSMALFNKTAADSFWKLFSEIYRKITLHPMKNVNEIFLLLDKDIKKGCPFFDVLSLKYFIATVKEGVK